MQKKKKITVIKISITRNYIAEATRTYKFGPLIIRLLIFFICIQNIIHDNFVVLNSRVYSDLNRALML